MLKSWITILLMLVIFFTGSQVAADMYKWVDLNGVTHYSDTPPNIWAEGKNYKNA